MVSDLVVPIIFAGDTKLFCTGRKLNILVDNINLELMKVYTWVRANKLSLNIEKKLYDFYPKMFSSYDAAYNNRWS